MEIIPDLDVRIQLQEICKANHQASADEDDYDIAVYEALKTHFLTVMQGVREVETIEEFIARGITFRKQI